LALSAASITLSYGALGPGIVAPSLLLSLRHVNRTSDGELEIDRDGQTFLVSHFTNGEGQIPEGLIFLAQVTRKGEVFHERDAQGSPIVVERVRPFPIHFGRSDV